MSEGEPLVARFAREHRELDALLGDFLAALAAADLRRAAAAAAAFEQALRRHTEEEERLAYPAAPAGGRVSLAPSAGEDALDRTIRELRLEHVQVRELAGILRRLLESSGELEAARGIAASLARRWDAHTTREERELLGSGPG